MLTAYVRARRPDGVEVTIDLFELEAALEGGMPARYYFVPDSGRIITRFRDDDLDEEEDETADDTEALEIDPIESRVRFQWMLQPTTAR